MRTVTFRRLITQPGQIRPTDTAELTELVQRYPWFALGHMLLAYNLEAVGHVARKEALARAALYAPDRKALHRLITRPTAQIAQPSEVPLPEAQAIVPLPHPAQPEIVVDQTEVEQALTPVIDDASEIKASREEIAESVPTFEPILYDLERELDHLPMLEPEVDHPTHEPERTGPALEEEPATPSALSFSSWLKATSGVSNGQSVEAKALSPKQQTAVIENFLAKLPTLEQNARAEFYSPEKAAKRSTDENALPVSETLARIYLNQGNTELAVRAFEHLALLHPEKKSYFAALAEKARQGQKPH